jgi:hypothetical protein
MKLKELLEPFEWLAICVLSLVVLSLMLHQSAEAANSKTLQGYKNELNALVAEAKVVNEDQAIVDYSDTEYQVLEGIAGGDTKKASKYLGEFKLKISNAKEELKKIADSMAADKAVLGVTIKKPATCKLNVLYVVVNVTTNKEYLYKGDPHCKTGNIVKEYNVATGMHKKCYNQFGGWWYNCTTPTSKWRIMSKQKSSGIYGPYFLRLSDLTGRWNYSGAKSYYALHGTNEPKKIGSWASHGCIRHLNPDITYLNSILPVGTIVWTVK